MMWNVFNNASIIYTNYYPFECKCLYIYDIVLCRYLYIGAFCVALRCYITSLIQPIWWGRFNNILKCEYHHVLWCVRVCAIILCLLKDCFFFRSFSTALYQRNTYYTRIMHIQLILSTAEGTRRSIDFLCCFRSLECFVLYRKCINVPYKNIVVHIFKIIQSMEGGQFNIFNNAISSKCL